MSVLVRCHCKDAMMPSIHILLHIHTSLKRYGVPGTRKDADGLERIFKNNLSMKMKEVPDLLHHITTMFSPRLLQQANIPVYKLLQHPGEFVVTFPRAFHGGFSMGPNIGEAVNFATSDWISHGSDASERYRSYARSAVFSHDRLTFTLARYLEEHSLASCIMLAKELERVISEELRLRTRLLEQGVRDVSSQISLPKNRLDQLDESSADYDDKRLCFSCKHVCFFSAVACECSQSKVSCLRHSHYMCRCPTHMRYMMMWSTVAEMTETLERVQKHITKLSKEKENTNSKDVDVVVSSTKLMLPPAIDEKEKLQRWIEHIILTHELCKTTHKQTKGTNFWRVFII